MFICQRSQGQFSQGRLQHLVAAFLQCHVVVLEAIPLQKTQVVLVLVVIPVLIVLFLTRLLVIYIWFLFTFCNKFKF